MLEIGKKAEFSKTISESDIYGFAGIVGDFNPVHVNEEKAVKSVFGGKIAHGMLTGSFISTVLGMYLPGPGTIYLSQSLSFLKPVYIGDTVTAEVEVMEVLQPEKGIYKMKTIVRNQGGDTVIDGEAVVKYEG